MKSFTQNRSLRIATVLVSVPAALMWIGVLLFCFKWIQASAAGRLEPGVDSSWGALQVGLLLAVLLSAGGIYVGVRAWRGTSNLKWQTASLIGAIVTLWAVCGD